MANRENNTQRWIIELTVIVGSIFLAFSIEAWWSERNERDVERVVLQSILEDLLGKREFLVRDIVFNQALLDSTRELLQLAASGNTQVQGESLDKLILDTWWFNGENRFQSAPLTALFLGGSSTVISNPILTQKLAQIHVSFTNIANAYGNDEDFHHNTLTPFYIEHTNLAQLAMSSDHPPGLPEEEYDFPDIFFPNQTDHSGLLSMPEFQSLLAAKMDRQLDIMRVGYKEIEQQLTETIEMLENELQQL